MKNKFSKKNKREDAQICIRSATLAYPFGDPDPRGKERKRSIKTIEFEKEIN